MTLALSKYILSRKDHIFDPRNIKLALVENDPIGDAFGVKAFHRCQVKYGHINVTSSLTVICAARFFVTS